MLFFRPRCFFCKKPFAAKDRRWWLFDRQTFKCAGKAHSTCGPIPNPYVSVEADGLDTKKENAHFCAWLLTQNWASDDNRGEPLDKQLVRLLAQEQGVSLNWTSGSIFKFGWWSATYTNPVVEQVRQTYAQLLQQYRQETKA